MIHVVTAENRHLYEEELLAHHRIRHDIYIVREKWDDLEVRNGGEYDQFDNDDAIYLLAIENDRVVGGSRFIPTIKPHLLSDVFPSLAAPRGIPREPDVFEWTRFFSVAKRRDPRAGGNGSGPLMCGVFEFLLDEEVRGFTFVCEAWWLKHTYEWGWKLKPLGFPELHKNQWLVASYVTVDADTLTYVRHRYNIDEPVLVRRGITQPALQRFAATG